MLIDSRRSLEIMYFELFERLGLKQSDLRPTSINLFGFSGQAMPPKALVTVLVGVGPIRLDVEFLVVDVPSPYNAIMGRSWIHRMKRCHQLITKRFDFQCQEESWRSEDIK